MLKIKKLNAKRITPQVDYIGTEKACSDVQSMLLEVMPDWVTSNEPEAIQFREDLNELVILAEEATANGTAFGNVISKTVNRTDSGSNVPGINLPRSFSSRMFVFNISASTSIWLAVVAVVVLFAVFAISNI